MLIIKISFPILSIIKIFTLAFKNIYLQVLKNIITFWFYNWPNCFKLYILFKILNKKFILTNQKSFILDVSFIKIGNLLFFIKLSKFALIMSIYSIKNLKSANIVKKIFSDLKFIIRTNVLLKSILGIWNYF